MIAADQMTQTVSMKKEIKIERADKPLSLLKWAGGKEQELVNIVPRIPQFHRYFEPFVGGGVVFFSVSPEKEKYINDKSSELINLYKMVADNNIEFFHILEKLLNRWQNISELVNIYAVDLTTYYNAYSTDRRTIDQLREDIFEFVLCHTEEFKKIPTWPFDKNVEYFIFEIEKNLIRKLARMRKLENKRGKLSGGVIS